MTLYWLFCAKIRFALGFFQEVGVEYPIVGAQSSSIIRHVHYYFRFSKFCAVFPKGLINRGHPPPKLVKISSFFAPC